MVEWEIIDWGGIWCDTSDIYIPSQSKNICTPIIV